MIDKIKELRVKLDGLTQLTQTLDKSREIALAITALQLAKMWQGKVLKELGNPNPYPESKNPGSEKIEPTADTAKGLLFEVGENIMNWGKDFNSLSHIAKVKYLRAELEKIENELYENWGIQANVKANLCIDNSYKYCIEAGLWLGMELGRIRDNGSK